MGLGLNPTPMNRDFTVLFSPVHVVLVSLLVDQLSGLFLIFLVDQNKNCLVSETGQKNFGQSMNFFWSVSLLEGGQKNSETDQKKTQRLTKIFLSGL